MAFAVQFSIEQCVAHFENQIPQPTIITVQNGTGDTGWSGDAHTPAETVDRYRGESERMMLAGQHEAGSECCCTLLSSRWPVAGLLK